ncbi:MAG: hypothetical protein B6244_12155 [Candidatus Cloacimonetes bacterium 4572_55]|nr:MAG: hypothetical protein B6244_12155 [Candidatus Cloacimonetes bacterium 4572_55]
MKENILIVEDNVSVGRMIQWVLQSSGYNAQTVAATAEDAIEYAEKNSPDLAILDIDLGGDQDGIDVAEQIRSLKKIPLIFLTSHDDQEIVARASKTFPYAYLRKPVNHKDLHIAIDLALNKYKLEMKIEQSKADYRMLFENMLNGVAYHKIIYNEMNQPIDYKFLEINAGFEKATGLKRDQIINRHASKALPDFIKSDKPFFDAFLGLELNGKPLKFEKYSNYFKRWFVVSAFSQQAGFFITIIEDITDKKRSEIVIQQAKKELESTLDAMSDLVILTDTNNRIIRCNKAMLRLLSCEFNDLIGKPLWDIFSSFYSDVHAYFSKKYKRPGQKRTKKIYKNGEWYEMSQYPVFPSILSKEDQPDVIHLVYTIKNITHTKKIAKIEREKEEIYRALFEKTGRIKLLINPKDGTIIDANPAACDYYGYSREKLTTKTIFNLCLHPKEEMIRRMGLADGETESSFQCQHRLSHGEIREIDTYYCPIEVRGKKLLSASFHDITDKKKTEERLKLLNTAVEQLHDAIMITDNQGDIQYVNSAFQRITGYTQDEVLGKTPRILKSNRHSPEFYEKLWETIKSGHVWRGNIKNKRKDGSVYDEKVSISPVKDEAGHIIHFVSVKKDVTKLNRLTSIAEAVNLMDNLGYIFSGIRHELGNPTNSLKMTLSVLDYHYADFSEKKVKEYIKRSLSEIRRIEYLLKCLRNFSLYDTPNCESIAIEPFINNFLSLITEDFEKKKISIVVSVNPQAKFMKIGVQAMHHILLNLFANASYAVRDISKPEVKIIVEKKQAGTLLKVIDNGVGMSDRQLANLFKPFYTSKPNGTGLGLVIVKKMLLSMNCQIHINSKMDEGTSVIITIPDN